MGNLGVGPDFVCIGAPKAGTGWLFDQLSWHPDVWMPPVKELRYLKARKPERRPRLRKLQRQLEKGRYSKASREREIDHLRPVTERDLEFIKRFLSEEKRNLKRYGELFEMKGNQITGDITPLYSTLDSRSIVKLMEEFPKLKIIYLIREPVSRAWSHIQMHKRQTEKPNHRANFDIGNLNHVKRFICQSDMLLRSCPSRVADRWRTVVPENQFYYSFFDDIISDPASVLKDICNFLGVSQEISEQMLPPTFNRKDSRSKYPMTPEIKAYLEQLFRDERAISAERFGGAAKAWTPHHP